MAQCDRPYFFVRSGFVSVWRILASMAIPQRKSVEASHDSRQNYSAQAQEDPNLRVWNQVRQHADKNFVEAKSLLENADLMHRKTESAKKQNEVAKLQYLRQLNAMTR